MPPTNLVAEKSSIPDLSAASFIWYTCGRSKILAQEYIIKTNWGTTRFHHACVLSELKQRKDGFYPGVDPQCFTKTLQQNQPLFYTLIQALLDHSPGNHEALHNRASPSNSSRNCNCNLITREMLVTAHSSLELQSEAYSKFTIAGSSCISSDTKHPCCRRPRLLPDTLQNPTNPYRKLQQELTWCPQGTI